MSLIPNINNQALQLLPDIALWKQQISDSINYKGGEANPNEAFTELAEDIKDIPNFDQYFRLAGVLAGSSHSKNALVGHNENVAAGNIEELNDTLGVFTRINSNAFQFWDLLTYIKLPSVQECGFASFSQMANLKYLYLESYGMQQIQFFRETKSIIEMQVGRITSTEGSNFYGDKPYLRNFIIGSGTDVNLKFNDWSAAYVIAEGQSGIDELNSNLYNNLLTKLYDHSQDGETRILFIGWLAKVSQANIDYATAKGWTLSI